MLILVLFICVITIVGVVAGLVQAGVLPGLDGGSRSSGWSGETRMLDRPGCLLALMVASVVWFAAWAVVLVLSLRFLRSVI